MAITLSLSVHRPIDLAPLGTQARRLCYLGLGDGPDLVNWEAVFATAAAGDRAKSSIGVPPVFRNEAPNLGCDVENSSAMQTPAPVTY
jgi:hypothetical protein